MCDGVRFGEETKSTVVRVDDESIRDRIIVRGGSISTTTSDDLHVHRSTTGLATATLESTGRHANYDAAADEYATEELCRIDGLQQWITRRWCRA